MSSECPFCGEPVLPEESVEINNRTVLAHRDCLLRQVVGSVAHQQGRCSCYGGDEGDDPALTRREAAAAAVAYFEREKGDERENPDL